MRAPPQGANPVRNASFPEFVWIWNRCQGLTTPDIHLKIIRWLSDCWIEGERELLLMAFRNSGKSTLVGLFCAWLLLQDANLRILVLAGEFSLAKKMVRNVRRLIERHPLTAPLYPTGDQVWAADQFTVRRRAELRDPSMLAKGVSANITGLRADVLICDDVEIPNNSDTTRKRQLLRERLQEAEYVLSPNGTKLYVGTPHSYYSIYRRPEETGAEAIGALLKGYRRLELPILTENGKSAWPERFSERKVQEILESTGPAKFQSQMMLKASPMTECRLDPSRLRSYGHALVYQECNKTATLTLGNSRLVSVSCWWDPSYGAPDKGDSSVVAAVFTDEVGSYWLHRVEYLIHDPLLADEIDEATQLCRQVADIVRELHLPAVTVETNGIGRFLAGLLRQQFRRNGLNSAVLEHTSRTNKDIRILEAFDAVLAAGRLAVHENVLKTPFVQEMREWRPGLGRCRDDGLDAVAGCLLSEPVRLPRLSSSARADTQVKPWRGGTCFQAERDFAL